MTQTELKLNTRETQAKRILKFLKLKGEVTNVEIVRMGIFRYSARLADLRKDGYMIPAVHVKDGLWKYVFKGHRDDDDEPPHKEYDTGL